VNASALKGGLAIYVYGDVYGKKDHHNATR